MLSTILKKGSRLVKGSSTGQEVSRGYQALALLSRAVVFYMVLRPQSKDKCNRSHSTQPWHTRCNLSVTWWMIREHFWVAHVKPAVGVLECHLTTTKLQLRVWPPREASAHTAPLVWQQLHYTYVLTRLYIVLFDLQLLPWRNTSHQWLHWWSHYSMGYCYFPSTLKTGTQYTVLNLGIFYPLGPRLLNL